MAILRQNTCHGAPGHLTTAANSGLHGDPWSAITGHAAYDHRPDEPWPCTRIGSPHAPASALTRSTGTVTALSAAAYLWVPDGAEVTVQVGGTGSGAPSVAWAAGGGLALGGTAVSAGIASATRGRLVRVEVAAANGTAVYRLNYANPLVNAPDHEYSAPYSGSLSTVRLSTGPGSQTWLDTLRAAQGEWLGSGLIGPAPLTASGPWVVLAQEDLMEAGYELPQWGADGFYGQEMSEAIQQLQTDHGLLVDGVMGQSSRAALDGVLNASRYATASGTTGWGIPLST